MRCTHPTIFSQPLPGYGERAANDSPFSDTAARPARRAFTLLEVLLALALVSFVLVAMAMAIDVHLRLLDSSRMKIEQAQLARAVLHRIADDLRRAVVSRPPEIDQSLATLGETAGVLGDTTNATEDLSGFDTSALDELAGGEGTPQSTPGLYGESSWLQLDVMRLPRVDQYDYQTLPTDDSVTVDVLSDVKTVFYGLQLPEETSSVDADGQSPAGLIYRELDRAVTLWSDQQGLSTQVDPDSEPLAAEVSDLMFEYFDGTEFVEYWDSDERGGLPVAVLISLAITPLGEDQGQYGALWSPTGIGQSDGYDTEVYRLLVHLPVSEPTTTEGSLDDMGGESGQSDSGGSSPAGSSPGGSSPGGSSPAGSSPGGSSSGGSSPGGKGSPGGPGGGGPR